MKRTHKNTILNYIGTNFQTEYTVQPERIFNINNKPIKSGKIVYLCEREIRCKDNFTLQFAIKKSKELNKPLKVIISKKNYAVKKKQEFIDKQIIQAGKCFENCKIDYEIIDKTEQYLKQNDIGLLIIDFNPIEDRNNLSEIDCKIFEIDGHNIIPARHASSKQEYNAATFRPKIYSKIYNFLTEFSNITNESTEADYILKKFIKNRIEYYNENRNNPSNNATSGLSQYLNLGFISSQKIALEIIKSDTSDNNKESFLEELIVRKELADNFCLHCKTFKTLNCISQWAKNSLKEHSKDIRTYLYTLKNFEQAETHDDLWNATQIQLKKEGKIHSYLRMYWAKKISEWTNSPQKALKYAIYLNDKYAYDAPSPNGYTGILWSIAALHDRPFQNWFVTGKIRRMSKNSLKSKFDTNKYIEMYSPM